MRVLIALVLLASAACDSQECHCPAAGCDTCSREHTAIVLSNSASEVSGVTTNSPCTTTHDRQSVLVSIVGPGTCNVQVQFTDGGGLAIQVRFDAVRGACGCYIGAEVTSSERTDAGSG